MRPNRLGFTLLITLIALLSMFFMGELNIWMVIILLIFILPMGFLSLMVRRQPKVIEHKDNENGE